MDDAEFEARHQRLVAVLGELTDLLTEHGESHWATWLAADRRRIEDGDRHGLDHLLMAFGGMGSLNDVVFHPINGNATDEPTAQRNTEALRRLTSSVYDDAEALRRALHRPRGQPGG